MLRPMRFPLPHSFRFLIVLSVLLCGMLGRIDTAQAQGQDVLTVSQSFYNVTSAVGGQVQSTTINVGSSAAPLNIVVSQNYTGSQTGQNWLSATNTKSSTPAEVTVIVNPFNLAIGTYTANVTITPSGAGTTPVIIPVTLNVVATTAITLSPASFAFTSTAGSTSLTPAQALNVSSASNGIAFTTAVTYNQSNPAGWLKLNPTFGTTSSSLAVQTDPTNLPVGTYTATITVSGGQGPAQVASVTFTITGLPTLTTSLSTIPFYYQIGQSQTFASSTLLTISTGSNASIPITLATTTSSCPGFLGVSQQGPLTTPTTIQVFAVNLGSYTQSQNCSGTITVTSGSAQNSTINIPVTLTVTNGPLVLVSPTSATFAYQVGGSVPANQNLTISSTTSGLPFSASSNQPWLSVTASGTTSTSSQITLSLVPSQLGNLIPNTYQAILTIVVPGAANSPINLPITLVVSANSMLTFNPPFVNFVYEIGQQISLNTQVIQIGSTGGNIPFAVVLPSSGSQFISVNSASGTTPSMLSVTPTPGTLSPGIYNISIGVTPSGGATQNIPVQLSISPAGQPQLNVSPQTLTFNYAPGQTPQVLGLALTSTNTTIPLTITSVQANSSWLNTSYPGGNYVTPQTLNITVSPTFLSPSSTPYTSNLVITATTPNGVSTTTTIPVVLNYTSGITLTATPSSVSFLQTANGPAPAPITVNVGVSGGTNSTVMFTTSTLTVSGGSWLTATTSGTAPGSISIGVNSTAASLTPGTYQGSVVIYGAGAANPNGTLTIPVTLTVSPAPTLVASTSGLTFTAAVGGSSPAAQTFTVTVPSALPSVGFTTTVATATGGNWLSVTGAGATPSTLTATATLLSSMAAGTYTGTITLTPAGGAAPTIIPVTFNVSTQIIPAPTLVINAASGAVGAVSPGEIVSIFGTALGPLTPAGLTLNAQGEVTTTLGGVTVSFNGVNAPLTYVSARQVNAVVPYEVAAGNTTQMQITYNGAVSGAIALAVQASTPGIFTQNGSGSGPGAILKPDFSAVSSFNPAPRGSTIIIYANGGGQTTPSSVTGSVASGIGFKIPNVTVMIGGISSTIAYVGSAPGLVSGVVQINVVVPSTISAGNQPVVVTVGNNTSQNGVTVAVQ
jgi:uncharacterized protein (TIGR03437 family)